MEVEAVSSISQSDNMFLGKCHFHLRTVAFMSVLVRTTKNESIICVHYSLVNGLLKDYNCFKLIAKIFSLTHDLNRNLSLNILSVNLSSQNVFAQLMSLIPRRDFNACVVRYKGDYRSMNLSCYDQFLVMCLV